MAGRVVHVNDRVPGAVYIGRPMPRRGLKGSPFGNPFKVEVHGRHMAILQYRDYLRSSQVGTALLAQLPELRDKPLACWCRHDGEHFPECHGDVLLALLDQFTDDQLHEMASHPDGQPASTQEG